MSEQFELQSLNDKWQWLGSNWNLTTEFFAYWDRNNITAEASSNDRGRERDQSEWAGVFFVYSRMEYTQTDRNENTNSQEVIRKFS